MEHSRTFYSAEIIFTNIFFQGDHTEGANLKDEMSSSKNGKSWSSIERHLHVVVVIIIVNAVVVVVVIIVIVVVVRVSTELHTRENPLHD